MRQMIITQDTSIPAAMRRRLFSAELMIGLIVVSGIAGVTAGQQRTIRSSSNQLAQQSGNDAAATLFRSGRDLITDEQWAKAQEKFNQLVTGYPNDKNVD